MDTELIIFGWFIIILLVVVVAVVILFAIRHLLGIIVQDFLFFSINNTEESVYHGSKWMDEGWAAASFIKNILFCDETVNNDQFVE